MKKKILQLAAALTAFLQTTGSAHAAGGPQPWQMWYQPAASPVAERMFGFHHALLYLIFAISAFVLLLLLIVIFRFNAKANPKPAQFAHNTLLEVIWTAIPVVIVILMILPSVRLIYYSDRNPHPDMTLKVTGYQWYWGYEYPDQGGISFLSNKIPDKEIDKSKGQLRLLSVDNPIVLPVGENIEILVNGADVIHSFSVPAFGIKIDAVPGRTNQTWVRITKPGTYYGQCDQLCGAGHSFMPIEVRAVSKEAFDAWVKDPDHKLPAMEAANDNDSTSSKSAKFAKAGGHK